MMDCKYKTISVVIPIYNAEKTIKTCVDSLLNTDYPRDNIEIILVDDGSTDSTSEALSAYNTRNIKIITQERQGIAAARNTGIKNAHGEIIVFVDADCFVNNDWLKYLIGAFISKNIGGVGGAVFHAEPETKQETYIAKLNKNLQPYVRRNYMPYLGTANVAYSKHAVDAIGFFDTNLVSGEDADFSWRLKQSGFEIAYESGAVVYHKDRSKISDLITQQFRDGRGWRQLERKYKLPKRIYKDIAVLVKRFFLVLFMISKLPKLIFLTTDTHQVVEPLYSFTSKLSYCSGYLYDGFLRNI